MTGYHPNRILVAEAIQALAMLELDPRYPVWMKRSLVDFQRTDGEPYKQIFSQSLSSIRLANAVRVYRYIKDQVNGSVRGCWYEERKAYKHGEYAMAFVFAKQFRDAIGGNDLIDTAKLKAAGSAPYDTLRQHLWDIIKSITWPGPLAVSKNQDHTLNVIRRLMTRQYALKADPAISPLRAKFITGQPYQTDLFKYLASKAPQVKIVT
jgi:hypothetical protein